MRGTSLSLSLSCYLCAAGLGVGLTRAVTAAQCTRGCACLPVSLCPFAFVLLNVRCVVGVASLAHRDRCRARMRRALSHIYISNENIYIAEADSFSESRRARRVVPDALDFFSRKADMPS